MDRELRVMLANRLWKGRVDGVTNAYIETEEMIVQDAYRRDNTV